MGNIIFGFVTIAAGISGEFALAGTNSSAALAVVGAICVVVGFVQVARAGDDD